MNNLFNICQGNRGAMMFMMRLYTLNGENTMKHMNILSKIERCNIKGSGLYVLYSDLGDRNIDTIELICNKVPDSVLTDACSRQDYSGRELIKPYLEND